MDTLISTARKISNGEYRVVRRQNRPAPWDDDYVPTPPRPTNDPWDEPIPNPEPAVVRKMTIPQLLTPGREPLPTDPDCPF